MTELKKLLVEYCDNMNATNYKKVELFIYKNTNIICKKKIKKMIFMALAELE